MRYLLAVVLLIGVSAVNAEAFRCVAPNGNIIFSDRPCDDGERFSKIRSSESIQDAEAARQQAAKQKAYADSIAAENEAARQSAGGISILPDESSPAAASSSGLSLPGSGGGTGGGSVGGAGTGAGPGNVPRGVPPPVSRK